MLKNPPDQPTRRLRRGSATAPPGNGGNVIGLAFNLVEQYLLQRHDEAALGAALRAGGFAHTDPWLDAMSYPEPDFQRWAAAAAAQESIALDELLRRLGRWAMPQLVVRYTLLTASSHRPPDLIGDLSALVLPQLRRVLTGYSGADFTLERAGAGADFSYHGSGALCAAIHGALLGLGDHFGVPLTVRETRCGRGGDGHCRFHFQAGTAVAA